MADRDNYQLRGPVQTFQSEFASLNPETSRLGPPKQHPPISFDRDGWQEGRTRDDGQTTTTFDEEGLRMTVGTRPPSVRRQRELQYGICIDANVKFDVLTRYDALDRPVEIVFRNMEQKPLHRIVLYYDGRGRIVREQVFMGDISTREWCGPPDALPPSAEQLEELAAELKVTMPDDLFTTIEYEYDSRDRVTQLFERMGTVSEMRRTFTYDDRDNFIEEHYESWSRDADVDADGQLVTSNESSSEIWTRHEYRYDEHGNWTERVAFRRVAPDPDFHRSSIARRTITYYEPLQTSNSAIDHG